MIPIQNIYHMLAYAFQALHKEKYRNLDTETFANVYELYAQILCLGVQSQIACGLGRGYVPVTESLPCIRGKADMNASVKSLSLKRKNQLVCTYDLFTVNNRMNQIIKSTLLLLHGKNISQPRKRKIYQLLPFFGEVDAIDLSRIIWPTQYHRNNQTYQLLMEICRLTVQKHLMTQQSGRRHVTDYEDAQQMSRLYEKFILNYFRREHPEVNTQHSQIKWQLDDGNNDFLPAMQTDVTISGRDSRRILILDAKYYQKDMQQQYDVHTIHSHNLYQLFTYVKNKQYEVQESDFQVMGMLLYARTDEQIQPDGAYSMSGNRIWVRTLDLNQGFEKIREQLDGIIMDCKFQE